MMNVKFLVFAVSLLTMSAAVSAAQQSETSSLDLKAAVQLALEYNPRLKAAGHLVSAAEGDAQQYALLPNPELYWRNEAARTGEFFDRSELIFGFSQAIPIGGRTFMAGRLGGLVAEQVRHGEAITVLEVKQAVTIRFSEALFYQEKLAIQRQIAETAQKHAALALERNKQGEIIPSEAVQAEIEHLREQAEAGNLEVLLQNALRALVVAIGRDDFHITSVTGDLEDILSTNEMDDIPAVVAASPFIAERQLAVRIEEAAVSKLRSELIPDINIDLSYRRLQEFNENTFDIGISITLPLFDRNQGAIAASQARKRAAESRLEFARSTLTARIQTKLRQLKQQRAYVQLLRDDLLPRVRQVLETAELRYASGDINLLEVLVARRQAAQYQLDYLEALRQAYKTWAEVQYTL